MMKKMVILIGIFLVIGMWFVSVSNQMVTLNEGVREKWSQVENVYQRRADLIPNLVNTVKGYAKHEAQVLEEVTKARAMAGQVRVNNPEDITKFDQAQGQLTQALSRLMVVAEKYPDLKANQNYMALHSELEGTENRIAVERKRFNESAREYNTYIKRFPQTLVAQSRGFQERPYFAAEASSKTAPKVEF